MKVSTGLRILDTPQFTQKYKEEAFAQAIALEIFLDSNADVDWSYASPPPVHLLDGEKTGTYRVQAGDYPITDENGESR